MTFLAGLCTKLAQRKATNVTQGFLRCGTSINMRFFLLLLFNFKRVFVIDVHQHRSALNSGPKFCAQKERSRQFPVQRVRFCRRRGQTMLQHGGNQMMDPLCHILCSEIKRAFMCKRLSQNQNRAAVGFIHYSTLFACLCEGQCLKNVPFPIPKHENKRTSQEFELSRRFYDTLFIMF